MLENRTDEMLEMEPVPVQTVETPIQKKQVPKGKWVKKGMAIMLSAALFGSVASAAFYGVGMLWPEETETAVGRSQQQSVLRTVSASSDGTVNSQSLDVSDIAEAVMPAMVSITNVSVEEVQSYFGMFGRGQAMEQEVESSGTGIIIGENDSELLIATNYHVIEDSETLSVCFVDNQVCEASVKGYDPDNDLAVIEIKLADIPSETKSEIQVVQIGNADELEVGEQVVAIGNALGYGQSVTTGIVSAMNRQIDTSDSVMIQTDAAINPGNSGGALVNMNGEVIGINSAKFASTDVEGMGYAISMTAATPIIEDLMNRATREKVSDENASYLGISGQDITSEIEEYYGIPQGIYVINVADDSPADEAGMEVKYVITHFDGIRVTGMSNLSNRMEYYAAGETVELTVQVANGNTYTEQVLTVTLGAASEVQSNQTNPFNENFGGRGGF